MTHASQTQDDRPSSLLARLEPNLHPSLDHVGQSKVTNGKTNSSHWSTTKRITSTTTSSTTTTTTATTTTAATTGGPAVLSASVVTASAVTASPVTASVITASADSRLPSPSSRLSFRHCNHLYYPSCQDQRRQHHIHDTQPSHHHTHNSHPSNRHHHIHHTRPSNLHHRIHDTCASHRHQQELRTLTCQPLNHNDTANFKEMSITIVTDPSPNKARRWVHPAPRMSTEEEKEEHGSVHPASVPAAGIHKRSHAPDSLDMIQLSCRTITVTNVEERARTPTFKTTHSFAHSPSPAQRPAILSRSSSRGSKGIVAPESNRRPNTSRRASSESFGSSRHTNNNNNNNNNNSKDPLSTPPLRSAGHGECMPPILDKTCSGAATTTKEVGSTRGGVAGELYTQAALGAVKAKLRSEFQLEEGGRDEEANPVTDQEQQEQLHSEPPRLHHPRTDSTTAKALFRATSASKNTDKAGRSAGHTTIDSAPDSVCLPKPSRRTCSHEPDSAPSSLASDSSSASTSTSASSLPSPKHSSTTTSSEQDVVPAAGNSLATQRPCNHILQQQTPARQTDDPTHHESLLFSIPPQLYHVQVRTRPSSTKSGVLENANLAPADPADPSQKRLSHRLSYLTHVEQFGAADDDDDDDEVEGEGESTLAFENLKESNPSLANRPEPPQSAHHPLPRSAPQHTDSAHGGGTAYLKCSKADVSTSSFSRHQSKVPSVSVPPRLHSTTRAHRFAATEHITSQPALPKLYRRLLRLFKPPSDSSDSGDAVLTPPSSSTTGATSKSQSRGPFGFPANPFGEHGPFSSSRRASASSSSTAGPRAAVAATASKAPRNGSPATHRMVVAADMVSLMSPTPQKHHVHETLGLRARLMRKLASSPNLKAEAIPLPSSAAAVPAKGGGEYHSMSSRKCSKREDRGSYDSKYSRDDAEDAFGLQQPSLTSFHHDVSCPAGQRMHARAEILRRQQQAQSWGKTLPRISGPTPTLQSKYGTPSRELGAGTQAQVMLLRVRSAKRLRDWYNIQSSSSVPTQMLDTPTLMGEPLPFPDHKNTMTTTPSTISAVLGTKSSPTSPLKMEPGTLKPLEPSGTITTTTSEHMTPEQREAYRKRLSSRFGGSPSASNRNSIKDPSRQCFGGDSLNGSMDIKEHQQQKQEDELIFAIKRFRPPKANESHRQYLKKICAEFCISTSMIHENIIRTIDLVRDQPGQDVEEEDCSWKEQQQQCPTFWALTETISNKDPDAAGDLEDESECDDCQCPNFGAYLRQRRNQWNLMKRRPVVGRARRKPSGDALAVRKPSPSILPPQYARRHHRRQHHRHHNHNNHHHHSHDGNVHRQSSRLLQQKMEEEQRQRDFERLKQEQFLQQQQQQHKSKRNMISQEFRKDHFPEYCMVMEFAAGGDLFTLLTKSHSPIGLDEKHCLWRQLINGVHYLHSMGVAHRDLKPENLLIDASGRILKITDFGIANVFKSVGDSAALPCRGILGSEPYIAPEEFYQEDYDPRMVDVWACGIIFYVMYYSAMPWARADRKKDARFARYVNDIFTYRRSEPLRRQQNARYMAAQQACTVIAHDRRQQHARANKRTENTKTPSIGVPASVVGAGNNTTFRGGSGNAHHSSTMNDTSPDYVYNTFAYNQFLGGHEFIDRIEAPGCRRVLYAILEPDARRRLTIEQVLQDEWVQQIRYCTNDPAKQEQQYILHHGLQEVSKDLMAIKRQGNLDDVYMCTSDGLLHHRHAVPKHVKA